MRPVVGLALTALAACTLTTPLDGFDEPVAPPRDGGLHGADARVPDGSVTAPNDGGAGDANVLEDAGRGMDAVSPPPELAPNPSFEDPSTSTCGPWIPFDGTLASDTTAHTGSRSCRVCKTSGTGYDIDIYTNLDATAKAGDTYAGSVWVRNVPGAASSQAVVLALRLYDSSNIEIDRAESVALTLTDVWQRVGVTHTLSKTPARLNMFAYVGSAVDGVCFLADDISLTK